MKSSPNRDFSLPSLKIVVDTNIFVSELFFGGLPEEIFELIGKKTIQPAFCPETFKELSLLLSHPKFHKQRKKLLFSVSEFLKNLLSKSILVHPEKILQIIKENFFDNYFLACAIEAQTSFIISGNKHLLRLKQFMNIPI